MCEKHDRKIGRRSFSKVSAGVLTGIYSVSRMYTAEAQGSTQEVVEVEMRTDGTEYIFDPIGLHVKPGDTVRWVNVSGTHSATAYAEGNGGASERRIPEGAELWNSEIFTQAGATFEYTFEEEGTYDYFCIPHKTLGMVGRIVCGEPGGPAEESENPEVGSIQSGEFPSSEAIVENGMISYPYYPSEVGGDNGGVTGGDDMGADGSSEREDTADARETDRTGGNGVEDIATVARESIQDPGALEFLLGGGILGGTYLAYRHRNSEDKEKDLSGTKECPACGSEIDLSDTFCGNCGMRLNETD